MMIISGSQFDKVVFALVISDLMFFPYIRPLSASFSMLILPVWFVLRAKVLLNDSDLRLSVFAFSIALVSLLLAFLAFPNGFALRNGEVGSVLSMVPNTVVVLYMFLYFLFFKSMMFRYGLDISKYLVAYLIFVFVLALFFYYDPSFYFKVRSLWTMYDNVIEVTDFGNAMFRFTSTLSEPNNLAAIVCAVVAYLLFVSRVRYVSSVFLIVVCSFIVIATMSSSGILVFALILGCFFIREVFHDARSESLLVVNIFSVALISFVAVMAFLYFQGTEVGKISTQRVGDNSIDSRFRIWMEYFRFEKIYTSLLWGDGGLVIIDGRVVNPHSGHLHLIFSYGLVFYLIFLFVFFYVWAKNFSLSSVFFVPIAVCFTINVGIYELRFAGLMALLIASYKVYCLRKKLRRKELSIC